MAGACATIRKAAFDGSVQFNTLNNGTIVTANEDGSSLIPYRETDANDIRSTARSTNSPQILGKRDFAGIHWRSDYEWGLLLGEAAAISVLRDQRNNCVGEDFEAFTVTKFDGTTITV